MTDDLTRTVEGEGGSGRLVGGRYQLVRRIGAGGMGEVFEAFDQTLERRVALKRPPREAWVDPRSRDQLIEEARVQARLQGPHIAGVQDVVDEGLGKPIWVVMKFVGGKTLKQILYERGRLEPDEAVAVALQVCAALQSAHEVDVVHRDLKPSNIMMDGNGWVFVLDFGIARLVQQTIFTMTGRQTSGTPLYMAPEQHIGGRQARDKRVDVFAFGAVLYEMLTGEPAFAEAADALAAKRERVYMPLKETAPKVPGELVEIVERCLAPQQDERLAGFAELEQVLLTLDLSPTLPARPAADTSVPASPSKVTPVPVPAVQQQRVETRPDEPRRRICSCCETALVDHMFFCPTCGTQAREPRRCGDCGQYMDVDAAYCQRCGVHTS